MKPLSGMDASFLYMETPSQLAHVVGTLILDPSAGEGFSYERLFEVLAWRQLTTRAVARGLTRWPAERWAAAQLGSDVRTLQTRLRGKTPRPPFA